MRKVEPFDFTLIATDGAGRSMPVIVGTGPETWDELADRITEMRKVAQFAVNEIAIGVLVTDGTANPPLRTNSFTFALPKSDEHNAAIVAQAKAQAEKWAQDDTQ